MPKKSVVVDPNAYSQPMELKRILEPVVTAAVLSWQNVMVVSMPGFGKSEILDAMGKQVFGAERTMLFPCVPSTCLPI